MDLELLTSTCIHLAQEAGLAILAIEQQQSYSVEYKDNLSPVTQADKAAEAVLLKGLAKLADCGYVFPCLSEESVQAFTASQPTCYWCIDPLDGTKDFLRKTGEYTVNIALIKNQEPILGVVHVPKIKKTYYAYENSGAWVLQDGGKEEVRSRMPDLNQLNIVTSRFHTEQPLLKHFEKWFGFQLQKVGSSLKFCQIAEGQADLYPRFTPCHSWDVAAAHCILRASGGEIYDLDLKPIRYPLQAPWLILSFIAFGSSDPVFYPFLEDVVQKYRNAVMLR